jgi:hypothetical protein
VWISGHLPGERDELIGRLSHCGDRDNDVGMGREVRLHTLGNGEDFFRGRDRAAAVFLNNDRS